MFRRPVDNHALRAVNEEKPVEALRDELISRFLLEHRRGFYTMHPVLRDTVLLQASTDARKGAHSIAGQHYARHFLARGIVGAPSKLGASFLEVRYHYTQSGDLERLEVIARRFETHVRQIINWTTPVPTSPEELNERVSLLFALLQRPGAKGLHYYLARLLERRGRLGDLERAVDQSRLAEVYKIVPV